MKQALIFATAFLIVAAPAYAAPAGTASKANASDMSSAKKQSQSQIRRNDNGYGAYARVPYYRPFADPSFDPSGRPYQPNVYTPCTIDLGYGRFTSCDAD